MRSWSNPPICDVSSRTLPLIPSPPPNPHPSQPLARLTEVLSSEVASPTALALAAMIPTALGQGGGSAGAAAAEARLPDAPGGSGSDSPPPGFLALPPSGPPLHHPPGGEDQQQLPPEQAQQQQQQQELDACPAMAGNGGGAAGSGTEDEDDEGLAAASEGSQLSEGVLAAGRAIAAECGLEWRSDGDGEDGMVPKQVTGGRAGEQAARPATTDGAGRVALVAATALPTAADSASAAATLPSGSERGQQPEQPPGGDQPVHRELPPLEQGEQHPAEQHSGGGSGTPLRQMPATVRRREQRRRAVERKKTEQSAGGAPSPPHATAALPPPGLAAPPGLALPGLAPPQGQQPAAFAAPVEVPAVDDGSRARAEALAWQQETILARLLKLERAAGIEGASRSSSRRGSDSEQAHRRPRRPLVLYQAPRRTQA